MDQAPVRQGHELVHHLLEISIARIEVREDTLRLSLRPDGADALLRSEDWSPVSSSRSRVVIQFREGAQEVFFDLEQIGEPLESLHSDCSRQVADRRQTF